MFQEISGNVIGNVIKDSREYVIKDSGECFRGFQGMFKKIPGNIQANSGQCYRRFRGMFQGIPGNNQENPGESKFRFIS